MILLAALVDVVEEAQVHGEVPDDVAQVERSPDVRLEAVAGWIVNRTLCWWAVTSLLYELLLTMVVPGFW